MQLLLTVPAPLASFLERGSPASLSLRKEMENALRLPFSITADPPKARLGSGGGTVYALYLAYQRTGTSLPLADWLKSEQRVVLHAGGESRRLPAYAALGKALLPLPRAAGLHPERFAPRLIEAQLPTLARSLEEAGGGAGCLVASGDVWLDFDALRVPHVNTDITGIGMSVAPEVAQHFGVFFTKRTDGTPKIHAVESFLQKPSVREIQGREERFAPWVDTGIWLLSPAALHVLFKRCGWNERKRKFLTPDNLPLPLDLYTEVGNALGEAGNVTEGLRTAGFSTLSQGVLTLMNASFLHLGSSRQLLDSSVERAVTHGDGTHAFRLSTSAPLSAPKEARMWIEQVHGKGRIRLEGDNIVTGLPLGHRIDRLEREWCVDVSPAKSGGWICHPYHLDDSKRGPANAGGRICGQLAADWLIARGLPVPDTDVFALPLYPILPAHDVSQEWLEWFFTETPSAWLTRRFASLAKVAAREIPDHLDFDAYLGDRYAAQAQEARLTIKSVSTGASARNLRQDMSRLALYASADGAKGGIGRLAQGGSIPAHLRARFEMVQAELADPADKEARRQTAFKTLAEALVGSRAIRPSIPARALKEDQIVWARSPVRLDLSGGWTDTPPYCLEWGGSVINVAILLNGQPPIQVFIRQTEEPTLKLRSIDLGVSETVDSYKSLAEFRNPRGSFSLAKAALAMAGFLPEFNSTGRYRTLASHLRALGGGLELSMLSAIPKGSGLGSSSILGATLLSALSRACGLGWDTREVYHRVTAVEQLLTTGGGWQDQAGALFPAAKWIRTEPTLSQNPEITPLPSALINEGAQSGRILLYYTGITRMAKGILQEIVTSMFLGKSATIETLAGIRRNTELLADAMMRESEEEFDRCIQRSWRLNQELDSGTNPPAVQAILDQCGSDLTGAKLLGAGGGGYLLICAKDADAGVRIKRRLETRPPNSRARFIAFSVAERGIEVTVS